MPNIKVMEFFLLSTGHMVLEIGKVYDELRRAKNVKNMVRRKYDRCKSRESCESFRRQRNYARLRKKSVRKYLAKNVMAVGKISGKL